MGWFSGTPTASIGITGSALGTALQNLLMCDEIVPGATPSYQLCKEVYVFHPLGKKMADKPITMAQSQKRAITIKDGPEDEIVAQFDSQWELDGCSKHIYNLMRLSRIYGIASLAVQTIGKENNSPIDYKNLWKDQISFLALDPLNTSGSLVLDQNPNSPLFQKVTHISVSGKDYHRTRAVVMMNEDPLYIEYTSSAFGFVGRSVYQRALYPLKSFVQTMVADDMVSRKAGVLIAKLKAAGAIVNNMMLKLFGTKRQLLKEAETNNVLSIDTEEEIESLNLENVDSATKEARLHIIENIALAADMPARIINEESFAEGFGEGTEDAKHVADYIDQVRIDMQPAYRFMDEITMYRAWTPDFYKTIQKKYPDEYSNVQFEDAFYRWKNSFMAQWPSFLREPDSEKVEVEEVKFRAQVEFAEVLLPILDPANKARMAAWLQDNINENTMLFPHPLELDLDKMEQFFEEQKQSADDLKTEQIEGINAEPKPPRADSAFGDWRRLGSTVALLRDRRAERRRVAQR